MAGPASDILDFGGVAMAPDGTGGLVYAKAVEGIPHVFVNRFMGGQWGPPLRVDGDQPYEASQARIAAGPRGELLVAWVTQVATVKSRIRYGLFAARLGRGAQGFRQTELVDPNVGEGVGVDPSLSGTLPGAAIVAYRAITYNFDQNSAANATAVQLRPGDVMADFRLARLKGDRWSRMGAVNRNSEASVRPPSTTNGPKVVTAPDGNAAVAWQEPDQTGTARIWLRRVFGTTMGPVLEASPAVSAGKPVTADADAFSLDVSQLAQVRIAFRIAPTAGSALAGRMLVNSMPPSFSLTAGTLTGAQAVDGAGPASGGAGPPGLAISDDGGADGSMRLAFLAGAQPVQLGVDEEGALTGVPTPLGFPGTPGAPTVASVDPEGGGVLAYPTQDAAGHAAVAVRQEFKKGAVQTGIVSGPRGGPVAGLAIGRSGTGDALIAFRQGEPGSFQIVAERVTALPASFRVIVPEGWGKPRGGVKLSWQAARSSSGPVRYAVQVGGRTVVGKLRRRKIRLRAAQLGNGVNQVRVLATDAFGQQLLSKPARLKVDGEAPLIAAEVRRGRGAVLVKIGDRLSGLKTSAVRFGDGKRERGGGKFSHVYERAGRYRVRASARDKAGNGITRSFEVRVR